MNKFIEAFKDNAVVIKVFFWDTSALIKLILDEGESSKKARLTYSPVNINRTTDFAVYETLNVFKKKWEKNKLTDDGYNKSCRRIINYWSKKIRISRTSLMQREDFQGVLTFRRKYKHLDFSDLLQLYAIKGEYSYFVGFSSPELVTADNELAKVASIERIKVLNLNQIP